MSAINTLNRTLGLITYLIIGGIAFFISMYVCVMIVLPMVHPDSELWVFVIWFTITIYIIGKSA